MTHEITTFIISHHPCAPVAIKDNFNILDNIMMQECQFAKLTNPNLSICGIGTHLLWKTFYFEHAIKRKKTISCVSYYRRVIGLIPILCIA
jgi:hypothetical protein